MHVVILEQFNSFYYGEKTAQKEESWQEKANNKKGEAVSSSGEKSTQEKECKKADEESGENKS